MHAQLEKALDAARATIRRLKSACQVAENPFKLQLGDLGRCSVRTQIKNDESLEFTLETKVHCEFIKLVWSGYELIKEFFYERINKFEWNVNF